MKLTTLVAVVAVIQGAVLIDWYSDSTVTARLAKENAEMRLADNRMTRGRTQFRKPGLGAWDYAGVSSCARAVGWPSEMLMSLRRTENGGMLLDLGIQKIPANIRLLYSPSQWQYAAGQQILIEEAGKLIARDRETFNKFAAQLSKRWGAKDTAAWKKNFTYFVKHYAKGSGAQDPHSNGGKKK